MKCREDADDVVGATDENQVAVLRCFCAELDLVGEEGAEVVRKLDKRGLREATLNALELAEIILGVEDHEYVDPEPSDVLAVITRRRLYLGLSPSVVFDFLVGFEEIARWWGFALSRAERISECMRQSGRAAAQFPVKVCSLLR